MIGSFGTGIMQFFEPSGISVDNYGNIAIGDSKNNRVQVGQSWNRYDKALFETIYLNTFNFVWNKLSNTYFTI